MEACSWELKGAGNANLIFSYKGQNPGLVGTVVRVRKHFQALPHAAKEAHAEEEASDALKQHQAHDAAVWHDILPAIPDHGDTTGREEHYTCGYLSQWIDLKYIPKGVACVAPEGLLQAVRDHGVQVNTAMPTQVFLDHTVLATGAPAGWVPTGPTLCAEIKPKAGCMPPTTYSTGPHSAVKARYPRYVLHALLKAVKGKGELNAYNPLDLFSGDAARIHNALEALLAAPNNNLRLFLDGKLLWGASATHKEHHQKKQKTEHIGSSLLLDPAVAAERLAELEAKLAAADFGGLAGLAQPQDETAADTTPEQRQCVTVLLQALKEVMCSEEILKQVLAVQQQDRLDVEGAAHAYAIIQKSTPPEGAAAVLAEHTEGELLNLVRGYLTATTAKDCGIMVALQRVLPSAGDGATLNGAAATAAGSDAPKPKAGDKAAPAAEDVIIEEVTGVTVIEEAGARQPGRQLPLVTEAAAQLVATQEQARGLVQVKDGPDGKAVHFMYKITLLDLDLKSVAKISHHAALDAEILATAAQHLDVLEQLNL